MSAMPARFVESDAPDLLLDEYRERMSIVDAATAEVAKMTIAYDRLRARPRRMVDLNDPKMPLAVKEVMQQEGMNRVTFPSKRYGCPACSGNGDLFHGATIESAAQLLMHLLECPSYDLFVSPLLGDARPF